jgi:hypothetical protein
VDPAPILGRFVTTCYRCAGYPSTPDRRAILVLVFDPLSGTPRKLDVGFDPSPSGGGMHFWQEEEVHKCHLIMIGYAPGLDSPDRVEAPALITGVGFLQSVFGYPNEEAFWKDPRGELGHGCYEIIGSDWASQLDDYNVRSFGAPLRDGAELHHYFIGSKDTSCQILASELRVEVFPEMSFQAVIQESFRRVHEERSTIMASLNETLANNPVQRELTAKAWEDYHRFVRERDGGSDPS